MVESHMKIQLILHQIKSIFHFLIAIRLPHFALIFLFFVTFIIPCTALSETKIIDLTKLSELLNKELIKDINLELESDLIWLDLRSIYTKRIFRPIWFDKSGLNKRAKLMLDTIQSANDQALVPSDYHLTFFKRHWNEESLKQQAWIELLLSKSLFLYCKHMYSGRLHPKDMNLEWFIDKSKIDYLALFQSIIDSHDFESAVRQLQPPHAAYQRLQRSLKRYKDLADRGGWKDIPASKNLSLGDHHVHVPLLRERLSIEGDLLIGLVNETLKFDHTLKLAVERFQIRHGLSVDGIVGPNTRFEMNVPVEKRIEQIALNMERWRWLPRDFGERYMLVNTAGYELIAYEKNQARFIMQIITGTPWRPTPMVAGPIQAIALNPYWFIPKNIAIKDIIPRQRRNPRFFKSMGIRVFTPQGGEKNKEIDPAHVDWSQISEDNYSYTLRQDPGPKNSLGQIKFKFANDFALYLHDTPKHNLFSRAERAFSSGCIRVENALDLAFYLLKPQNNWSKKQIAETIQAKETQTIPVTEEIPVYLVYWTVWVGTDNAVYFRKDVYGWDQIQLECQ